MTQNKVMYKILIIPEGLYLKCNDVLDLSFSSKQQATEFVSLLTRAAVLDSENEDHKVYVTPSYTEDIIDSCLDNFLNYDCQEITNAKNLHKALTEVLTSTKQDLAKNKQPILEKSLYVNSDWIYATFQDSKKYDNSPYNDGYIPLSHIEIVEATYKPEPPKTKIVITLETTDVTSFKDILDRPGNYTKSDMSYVISDFLRTVESKSKKIILDELH